MPLYPKNFIPQEMKTSIIKFFSYVDRNPVGILINPYFEQIKYFKNLNQLLMLMEEMHDSINYPQESMETRSVIGTGKFRFTPEDNPSQQELKDIAPIATFKLSVHFRRNASWQGSVAYIEQAVETQFRSVLELIKLIDSMLSV